MAGPSDFRLSEYQNISQAHFKTNEMIATFFRYYVLVMVIPITVVVSAVSAGSMQSSGYWPQLVGTLFLMIAVIGHFIGRYISGLKYKAVIYARQVNVVRKHFHDMSESKVETVLPTDPSKPSLIKQTDYRNIVRTFAVFTAFYFCIGAIFVLDFSAVFETERLPIWLLIVVVLSFFSAVLLIVWDHDRYFRSREKKGIE